MGTRKIR